MQTLRERIEKYCTEHKAEQPYGRHLDAISRRVIAVVKEMGKYDEVKKKNEPFLVNNYPASMVPIIDGIIDNFFVDRRTFLNADLKVGQKEGKIRVKYFCYDVEAFKIPAFEAAMKYMGIEIFHNKTPEQIARYGVAQYRIPITDPAKLIKLGKRFQKERNIQLRREHLSKRISENENERHEP